jgi:putative CocE/NonD family hydrolase
VDTDWTAKLCDVYPDGRSMLVSDGILRARYRNSFETPEMLVPGEIYEFVVDLWSTAIVFNTGHRLRVDLSSSNSPRFDPNPNTGDPLHQNTATVIATNRVYFNTLHPSQLILPVTAPAHHPLFDVPVPETSSLMIFF